jgi:hypothetical protein
MRTEQRLLFDFVKDLLADWYQPAVSPAYVDSRDGNRVRKSNRNLAGNSTLYRAMTQAT